MNANLSARLRISKQSLFLFLMGPAFIGALSLLAWIVVGGGVLRVPQRIEFVIPQGAAERVEAGEAIPSIPAKSVFIVGDELILRNEDQVNHQMGPFWIPARTSITIPMNRESTLNYLCTIHPSGYIGLQVRPRDGLLLTLIPTFGLGVPIGAVLALVVRVMARLG